jgi:transcriptional regulator of acetoin/glycerol metabolism
VLNVTNTEEAIADMVEAITCLNERNPTARRISTQRSRGASAQAKFLRVLQEREFQRLGGTCVLKANIRVIAATNRDLRKAVERGDFREDLYYRLQVFDIRIAPLRERRSDILLLSESFLQEIGKSFGRPPAGLTKDARDALLGHDWPGMSAAGVLRASIASATPTSVKTPSRAD